MLFKKKLFLTFFFLIITLKIYYLLISPRELYFFITGLTKFNFYNTLSFSLDMQSFRDANHPGTPIYFIGFLILQFTGNQIKNFYEYFYIHHFLIFLINIISVNIFINYFKKFLKDYEIYFFLIIFISTFNFIFSLEIICLISYQFSITLILVTYYFKFIKKGKYIKLSIISAFAISMKMTFLPFIVAILISFLQKILSKGKHKFKKILQFFSLFSFSFLILNFPILGRLPRIFLDIFFLRNDTSLTTSTESLWLSLKDAVQKSYEQSQIYSIVLLLSLSLFVFNLFQFFKKNNKNFYELKSLMIFNFIITIFFLYTFIIAGQTYNTNFITASLEEENIFRNNFPYIIFIFLNFFIAKNYFQLKIFKNHFLIFLSTSLLLNGIYNYHSYRIFNVEDKIKKQNSLILQVKKYVNLNRDIIAYNTYSLGYGFGDEIFHHQGNSLEGNEYFTDEIINLYPNFRLLRLNDIYRDISETKKNKRIKLNQVNKFKNKIKNLDDVLKKKLPNFLYEIVSFKSKNSYFNKEIVRSDDIYTFQKNNKFRKADVILFSDKRIIKTGNITENEIYEHINKRLKISKRVEFKVKDDLWYLYKLN